MKKLIFAGARILMIGLIAYTISGIAEPARAGYPDRTIICMVPFSPGGGMDTYARQIGRLFSKKFNVSVAIKNVPGGGGRRGATFLYKSRPNGYTMGWPSFPSAVIYQVLTDVDYDTSKFVYAGGIIRETHYITVRKQSPFHTLEDLKKADKPLRIGVSGPLSNAAVFALVWGKKAGVPITLVTGFSGPGPPIAALLRGDIDFLAYSGSINAPYLKSGDFRAIMVLTEKRVPMFPDVPTSEELGFSELNKVGTSRLLVLPPGTPPNIAKIVEKALKEAVLSEEMKSWAKKIRYPLGYLDAAEASKIYPDWSKLVSPYKDMLRKGLGN